MGYSEKAHQVEGGGFESEGKKWVIVGIPIRTPLRKIRTKKIEKEVVLVVERTTHEQEEEEEEYCSSTTTPTSEEAKIPERISCPPAPRKKRPSSRCNFNATVREFFTPPDLDSVFIHHVERAKLKTERVRVRWSSGCSSTWEAHAVVSFSTSSAAWELANPR